MSVALPFKYLGKSSKLIWRFNGVSEDDCLTYTGNAFQPHFYLTYTVASCVTCDELFWIFCADCLFLTLTDDSPPEIPDPDYSDPDEDPESSDVAPENCSPSKKVDCTGVPQSKEHRDLLRELLRSQKMWDSSSFVVLYGTPYGEICGITPYWRISAFHTPWRIGPLRWIV